MPEPQSQQSQKVTREALEKGTVQVETGQAYHFVVESPNRRVRIVVEDDAGRILAGKKYSLKAGEKTYDGTTTDAGLVDQEIPSDLSEAHLEVTGDDAAPHEWSLKFDKLPPSRTAPGVSARLKNLGYDTSNIKLALRQFQEDHGLPATGNSDSPTVQKLVDLAGA